MSLPITTVPPSGTSTCAAALANIDILIGERLWENAERVGRKLLSGLSSVSSPRLGDVRGRGLMIGIELVGEDGELLGVAAGTSKSQLFKARVKMREMLGSLGNTTQEEAVEAWNM